MVEPDLRNHPEISSHSLLSQERSQKFDLLLHLISNLRRPIVLCGPDGIGKTTVLEKVSQHYLNAWIVCFVESSSKLNVDAIRLKLCEAASGHIKASIENDLSRQLKYLEESGQSLVLLLDDAGCLVPGVLKSLWQLAETHSALRLVFSMRPDHLHVKASTDFVLDECHIVDLPPLNEPQCSEFLKNLSADPHGPVAFKAITPAFVERVYTQTHGIPGAIINVLPKLLKDRSIVGKNKINSLYAPIAAVIIVVAGVSVWKSLFQDLENQSLVETTITVSQNSGSSPKIEMLAERKAGMNVKPEPELKPSETKEDSVDEQETVELENLAQASGNPDYPLEKKQNSNNRTVDLIDQSVVAVEQGPKQENRDEPVKEIVKVEDKPQPSDLGSLQSGEKKLNIPGVNGVDWLLAQNPTHWTVQLIVVSRLDSLKGFVKKYLTLKSLAAFQSKGKNKPLFFLFHGSYPSRAEAKLAMNGLPPSLGKLWPRKFKIVHAEIKTAQGH